MCMIALEMTQIKIYCIFEHSVLDQDSVGYRAVNQMVCCVQYKARFTQSGLVSAIEQNISGLLVQYKARFTQSVLVSAIEQ